ncbi:MAG TPA: SDR family oxidoreductase [Polyangiaceae bacterium]|jgi:NAD(P)-dependent dehydrogenase (short-subunit alcohol dehydrogenase family)|nr:SDR family oxidoreductase [Polyangiaceae bacterium]
MTKRKFADKRVVITGAGSGLGRALSLRFARERWRVGIADINVERAEETLKQVRSAGGDGFVQRCDVALVQDFEALADRVKKEWGGIDVVINNAGIASAGTVHATTLADWEAVININLLGVVRGCHTFVPMLLSQHSGHVVNIASFAAIASAPGMASYNVAKAGVFSLSESLRAEVFDEGVDVTVACPAFFRTNLLESFRGPDPKAKVTVARIMERATVTAEDVANDIYEATMHGRFLVISHADSRWQYRMKRAAPELFYREVRRMMKKMVTGRTSATGAAR